MQRFYDVDNERLIYVDKEATKDFWDDHWLTEDFYKAATLTPNSWVARTTKKYLRRGSTVLEGGCGLANSVYALQNNGFKSVGLDFAPKTVKMIKSVVPELNIKLGDVRSLPFEDGSFDGYWSMGVIEHFWNGYDDISAEMLRVLRLGGHLFLTFPYMSSLRKWKANNNKYVKWENNNTEPNGFYQFALSSQLVLNHFNDLGFELVRQSEQDGIKGVKDEIPPLKPNLQTLYNSNNLPATIVRKFLNLATAPLFGHIKLLILRKL